MIKKKIILSNKLNKKIIHSCQDYCAICNPVHALEVLIHKAIIKQRKLVAKLTNI